MTDAKPSTVWLLVGDEIAGHYHLEGESTIFYGSQHKPNWLRRTMMRLLFGMRWQPFTESLREQVGELRNIP